MSYAKCIILLYNKCALTFLFLRQDPGLVSSSLWGQGYPWASGPPASASQVEGYRSAQHAWLICCWRLNSGLHACVKAEQSSIWTTAVLVQICMFLHCHLNLSVTHSDFLHGLRQCWEKAVEQLFKYLINSHFHVVTTLPSLHNLVTVVLRGLG